PEAEGPSNRLLFDTKEEDLLHSLPVTPLDTSGRVRLDCAPLLRIQRGDELMVMPAGATHAERSRRIGDLTVESVGRMSAAGTVAFAPAHSKVPMGARAFRTRVTAPRLPLRVPPPDDPRTGLVLRALQESMLARPAEPGDDWVGEVRITDGGLQLC